MEVQLPYRTEQQSKAENISSGAGAAQQGQTEAPAAGGEMLGKSEGESAVLSRRAAVRQYLIQPLEAAGLQRNARQRVADHDALLDKMQDRLGYLAPDLLTVLAEAILRLAEGPLHNTWPTWATIWNNATRILPPPDDESHIMTTWLASIEGPVARSGGYLVELHSWLRRHGRPPGSYDMSKIRERAAENQRRRVRIEEWVAKGHAKAEDREWLDAYLRAQAQCEALVAMGEAKRVAKGMAA